MRQLTECCCFSLKTGTLIIGVLQLIGSFISVVSTSLTLADIFGAHNAGLELQVPFILLLVLCFIQIIFNIFLIVGTKKEEPSYVGPWLVFNIVLLVLATLAALIVLFCSAGVSPLDIWIFFLSFLISLSVSIYMLRVVYSFYISITIQESAQSIYVPSHHGDQFFEHRINP